MTLVPVAASPACHGTARTGAASAFRMQWSICQILCLHSVDALADDNLGMLGIADIAAKYAVAAFPPNSIAWRPCWRDASGSGRRAPGVALARLARPAAG
jgi:hypothetical protein